MHGVSVVILILGDGGLQGFRQLIAFCESAEVI